MQTTLKSVKKYLRTLRSQPGKIKSQAHIKYPNIFGFETSGPMVQFYRNDEVFQTLVSFNHFIEAFTDFSKINVEVQVQAYDRNGNACGAQKFSLRLGAKQFYLHDLIKNLDAFGMFSLAFKLHPSFVEELEFLQKLSCQFMTIYVPKDGVSAPQMVHSHKELQGKIWLSRELIRRSNSIENLNAIVELQFYFINPSASFVETELIAESLDSSEVQLREKFLTPPYSCYQVILNSNHFQVTNALGFTYKYNKNINHKKPIVFRKFKSGQWSANHT